MRRAISIVRSVVQSHSNGHSSGKDPQEDRRPIIVRLDGLAQTNDMLAIREMGRQIALGQGEKPIEDDDQDEDAVQAAEVRRSMARSSIPTNVLTDFGSNDVTCALARSSYGLVSEGDYRRH